MERSDVEVRARAYVEAERDERFANEIRRLIEEGYWDDLADRFYTDLEFGTGGLRGVIGGGFNRMNPFVVQRATTGLARYAVANGTPGADGVRSAVIAHDSRRFSREFALQAALVFAAHGMRAYLFADLRPTPQLSFAVRELGATTGIVITASHNPPQYNGYKVYWSDGAQIIAPQDAQIIAEVMAVTPADVAVMDEKEAREAGLLVTLGPEMDDAFVAMVKRQSVQPQLLADHGADVKAVYTPLHGTGAPIVERVLGELGVTVVTVPEQREPDGEFPTVKFPNPEEASAMELAVALGEKERADIVLGTDPDADRLGIAVPDGGAFRLVTGNQLGVLLADYILGVRGRLGTLPERPVFVTTIVTTGLQDLVAAEAGAEVRRTLTGFKHIAATMRELEEHPERGTYVMGDEESYGYLIGTEVRDKDSITATVLTVEMALHWRGQGLSVMDRLRQIWRRHGYWEEQTISTVFPGQAGRETMDSLMASLRSEPPKQLAGIDVVEVVDIQRDLVILPDGTTRPGPGLPASNVLQFELADGSRVSARPSGTEPKIKFYASCHSDPGDDLAAMEADVAAKIGALEAAMNEMVQGAS